MIGQFSPVPTVQQQSVLIRNYFAESSRLSTGSEGFQNQLWRDFWISESLKWSSIRENVLFFSESEDNSKWITELAMNQTNSVPNVTWIRFWLTPTDQTDQKHSNWCGKWPFSTGNFRKWFYLIVFDRFWSVNLGNHCFLIVFDREL